MNSLNRFTRSALVALVLVGSWEMYGCASTSPNTSTPAAPTPPQVTVANAVNALAQAVDGAVTAAIAARTEGKVSQADLTAIEAYCKVIATTGTKIDAELRSSDPWATQKTVIVQLVTASGLATLKTKISPGAQALVVSLVIVANQISSAVGGPVI